MKKDRQPGLITGDFLIVLKGQRVFGPFQLMQDVESWTSGHIIPPYVIISVYSPADVGRGEKAHECGTIIQVVT